MFEDYPDILTPEDVGEMLRVGRNTVYNYLTGGQIAAFRNGRVWRIAKPAVIDFVMKPYASIVKQ